MDLLFRRERLAGVSVLEEGTFASYVHGVADIDALHDVRQVAPVHVEHQMIFIGRKNTVGVESEPEFSLGSAKYLQESLPVGISLEQGVLSASGLVDIIESEGFLDAGLACHVRVLLDGGIP
jgi:hypothetical protein